MIGGLVFRTIRKGIVFFILFLAFAASAGALEQAKLLTGKDWLLMSYDEKQASMVSSMRTLREYHVPLEKKTDDYIALMDEKTVMDADSRNLEVTQILAFIVYDTEPAAKDALDRL